MKILTWTQTELGKALLSAPGWPDNCTLLLPKGKSWNETTASVIAVCDPYDEDDPRLEMDGEVFTHALQKGQVEQILYNSKEQLGVVTETQAVQAFLFYYDRDAFIDWGRVT